MRCNVPGPRVVTRGGGDAGGKENDQLLIVAARLDSASGEPASARAILDRLRGAGDRGAAAIDIDILSLATELALNDGQLQSAVTYGHAALDLIGEVHGQLESRRLGPAWSQKTAETANRVAIAHLRFTLPGRHEAALTAIERTRGLHFRQLARTKLAGIDEPTVAGCKALARAAQTCVMADRLSTAGEVADLEYYRQLERAQARVGGRSPAANREFDLYSLQNSLGDGAVALDVICVAGHECNLKQITGSAVRADRIGDQVSIQRGVSDAVSAIRTQSGDATSRLIELANSILVRLSSGARDVLVVNSGVMASLPVEAMILLSRRPQLQGVSSVRRIPTLAAVGSTPSSLGLGPELVIVANPTFGQDPNQVDHTDDSFRPWAQKSLRPLPGTQREAEAILKLFADSSTRLYSGPDATRVNLLSAETRSARIIHIASHGYFSAVTPDMVGIATAAEAGQPFGFVTATELESYDFAAELVVVSGCETGLGLPQGGEGMLSVGRSFLARGAHNVVATLWPVSDSASADFMHLFYAAMKRDGEPPAPALHSARRLLPRAPRTRAPLFWAGYTLASRH